MRRAMKEVRTMAVDFTAAMAPVFWAMVAVLVVSAAAILASRG